MLVIFFGGAIVIRFLEFAFDGFLLRLRKINGAFFLNTFCSCALFVGPSQLPLSVYTHHHIQIGLLVGGDRVECCTHAFVFSFMLIAMY